MGLWKEMERGVFAWGGSTEIQLGQVNPVACPGLVAPQEHPSCLFCLLPIRRFLYLRVCFAGSSTHLATCQQFLHSFLIVCSPAVSGRVSVALMKHHDQSVLGRKGVIGLTLPYH